MLTIGIPAGELIIMIPSYVIVEGITFSNDDYPRITLIDPNIFTKTGEIIKKTHVLERKDGVYQIGVEVK